MQKILFHPSSLHEIMTDAVGSGITPKQIDLIRELEAKENITSKQKEELSRLMMKRDAPPELSETCKRHLVEVYVNKRFGREKEVYSEAIEKGLAVEEEGITLYSFYNGAFYKKNLIRIENEYLTGQPDIIDGAVIIDIKCSWDIFTFFSSKYSDRVNKAYFWQGMGYLDLVPEAQTFIIAYCLIDTPPNILNDMKRRLQWQMGVIDPETDENYRLICEKLDFLHKYEDVPQSKRITEVVFHRDEAKIKSLHDRIDVCREWMLKTFDWS